MAAMSAFFLKIPLIAYSKKMKVSTRKYLIGVWLEREQERTESSLPALVLSVQRRQCAETPNVADIMSAYARVR